ncbi:hypothetical protein [Sinirhodobacter huangdaonensis]|uniref:hypothetical protein n=1 Tax=Paenirhodobacter huangdaonensis TaxID=2501515 RepID=UPI0013E28989|nr:hypothetical protein [Sinirhodobacter huangdaonensis]
MVGASKILTVSYGTFSCTLEGFDEPFNTMKAIAEYFRDLAADDRYFGAEPPQPDAEMLHRIAEREIQRRVEAKIQRNGVILRQAEATPAPAEITAAAPAPEPAATEPAGTTPTMAAAPEAAPAVTETTVPEAPAPAPEPPAAPFVVPQSADPVSESVAAKLQRIRAAVASAKAAAAAPVAAPVEAAILAEPATMPEPMAEPVSEPVAEMSEPVAEIAEEPAIEASILLEEIAAVAEQAPAAPAEGTEAATDAAAGTGIETETAGETTAAAPETATDRPEAEEDAAAESTGTPEEAPHLSWAERRAARRAAQLPAQEAAAPEPAPAEAPAAAVAEAAPKPEAPRPPQRARVIKVRRIEPTPPAGAPAAPVAAEAPAETASEEIAARVAARLDAETVPAEADAPALSAEQEAELMAELAALEQDFDATDSDELPGADTEAALAAAAEDWDFPEEPDEGIAATSAAPEEIDADTIAAALAAHLAEPAPAAGEAMSPDTAADAIEPEELAAQIAAMLPTEAAAAAAPELAAAQSPEPEEAPLAPAAEAAAPAPVAPVTPRRVTQKPAGTSRDADVTRLMEEADAQLSGHENRRRLSAIAHLKAAVAATVADRLARGGRKEETPDDTRPYRDDLTHAVQPRRPVLHGTTSGRPAPVEPRQAPLVLVSEQRIDRTPAMPVAPPAAVTPVRPRRVSTAQLLAEDVLAEDALAEDDGPAPLNASGAESFADFAQAHGTQGLSDLLEAAAAYTAQIEGRPHFSPPQIMSKITAIGAGSFSREERLRSFGQLLRQGKIAKVKRGQYAITEQSQYFEKRA